MIFEEAEMDLTQAEARALTDRIKDRLSKVLPLIVEAFERRADVALGYESWAKYCYVELNGLSVPLGERAESVAKLRQAGMSGRAIGSALGIDEATVRKDLKRSTAGNPAVTQTVTGLDGREQPSCRPVAVGVKVRTSPLWYADQIGELLSDMDEQHYGPNHLTAEQIRVLGNLRKAMQQFATIFRAQEEESIRKAEMS